MINNISIICNPTSGKQKLQDKILVLQDMLEKDGAKVDIYYTGKQGDGEILGSQEGKKGQDLVIAVGGDGTLNEVVNGLMKSKNQPLLALYPTGTVNDFGTFLKTPKNIHNFYKMVKKEKLMEVDVGVANGRYFLNVVAGGTITEVAHKVSSQAKTVLGKMAYFLEGAKEVPRQIFTPVDLTWVVDDKEFTAEALFFLVSNSKFVGGFKYLMKEAEVDDGKLDLLVVEKMPVTDFLNLFLRAIGGGYHLSHSRVHYHKASSLFIKASTTMEIDVDGEYLGNTPVEVKVIKKALKMVVP